MSLLCAGACFRANLRNGQTLAAIEAHQVSHNIGSPVAVTNDTEIHDSPSFFRTADWLGVELRRNPVPEQRLSLPVKGRKILRETSSVGAGPSDHGERRAQEDF